MGKSLLNRLGNYASILAASALLSLGGYGKKEQAQLPKPEKPVEQTQIYGDKFSNCTYTASFSYFWDSGTQIALYGEPLDKKDPERFAFQLKSLEDEVKKYEEFKERVQGTCTDNFNFPVFTIDSLTNPAVIAQQDKSSVWNRLNKENLGNTNTLDYFNLKIPLIFYQNGNTNLIKILNESENKPVVLYFYTESGKYPNEDEYRVQFGKLIDKLFLESTNTSNFILKYDNENCNLFHLNKTHSKIILLKQGVRTIIFFRGESEPDKRGIARSDSENIKEIQKRLKGIYKILIYF